MKVIFSGDLANFAAPAIGQNVLNILLARGKCEGKTVEQSLVVSVGGKTILAAGRYDPKADTLTVNGYLG